MDKIIEKKTGWRVAFTKKALPWWLGALLLAFIVYLIARPNNKTLRVDKDTLTVASAVRGEFNDYIRISGRVQPMTTIQLSPQEGGIVEKILIEEGSPVKAGDAILILNNDNLDLQILNSEAELAEKENILRNTQIQMEQQKLDVRQNVLEYGTQVDRLKRAYEQQKALYEDKLIAKEDYQKAEEDYKLALQKYDLIRERSKQDSLYRGTQIDRMEESLENMLLNMSMIRKRKGNLIVKAPIDGELGLLDVVLGQSIAAGTKIGQINSVGTYKVEAQIDEHYIDRVIAGLEASIRRSATASSRPISSSTASSPTTSAPARPTTSTSSSASPKRPSSSRAAPSTRKPVANGSTLLTKKAPRPSKERYESAGRTRSTTKCSKAWSPVRR